MMYIKNKNIPNPWQKGEIITFYKGKGTKCKCSNERGINLASNFGKLYERIINNRAREKIQISEAQAGGQAGKATSDHIRTLTDLITIGREGKNPVYVTYLDVTKAYDKAWLDAILYVLEKQGLKDPTWLAIKNLNQNLTAHIQTKYGPTREIKIKDSIRQGGVLSVIMYATLMDEIGKEIAKHNIGIKLPQTQERIGCLLWMDDVALIANNHKEMQNMLNITEEIANRYRIKFGEEKTKTMIIKGSKKTQSENNFALGEMQIGITESYKYLGLQMNNKCNLKDHIQAITGRIEGAYQTIIMLAHDSNFDGIQMELIWKLVEACIIPIITYSSETWNPNKKETKQINQILDSLLKRILKTPTTTPREALYIETGLLDPKAQIDKKRIMMVDKISQNPTKTNTILDNSDNKKSWKRISDKKLQEYKMENTETNNKKEHKKTIIKTKIKDTFKNRLLSQAENKSKVQHLRKGKGEWTPEQRSQYMTKMTRNECSIIFRARTRMLDIKNNFKGKYGDDKCRACKIETETQDHVLEKCPSIHTDNNLKITMDELFDEDTTKLKPIVTKLYGIMDKINNK